MELLGERGRVKFKIIKKGYFYIIEARSPYFKKYNNAYFEIRKGKSIIRPPPNEPISCNTDSCFIMNFYPREKDGIYNCQVYINGRSEYVDEIKFYVN